MAQEQYGQTHADGEHQVESPAVIGIAANRLIVFLTNEVAYTDGHGGSHTREYEIEELGEGDHHLVGCQRYGSEPSHHHTTEGESRRLHAQLQGYWPS